MNLSLRTLVPTAFALGTLAAFGPGTADAQGCSSCAGGGRYVYSGPGTGYWSNPYAATPTYAATPAYAAPATAYPATPVAPASYAYQAAPNYAAPAVTYAPPANAYAPTTAPSPTYAYPTAPAYADGTVNYWRGYRGGPAPEPFGGMGGRLRSRSPFAR